MALELPRTVNENCAKTGSEKGRYDVSLDNLTAFREASIWLDVPNGLVLVKAVAVCVY